MSELRWILIGLGIVLLAGIYLWGRRGSAKAPDADAPARLRPEPSLHPQVGLDDYGSDGHGHAHGNFDDVVHPPAADSFDGPGAEAEPSFEDEQIITAVRPATRSATPARRPIAEPPEPERPVAAPVSPADQESWRGRVEPTFSDASPTEELPVPPEKTSHAAESQAPTLSSSETPAPKRIERRKILSLRLAAAPQRFDGAKLLEALRAEALEHGKYAVFHRLHDDGVSIFSIASMVEPGTFDLEKMPQVQFPGITLFAQLPGPVPGMHALNELVACSRRLQQSLGGTLQDDRGVPLTVHRIERLRQEVREFERPPTGGGARGASTTHSISP